MFFYDDDDDHDHDDHDDHDGHDDDHEEEFIGKTAENYEILCGKQKFKDYVEKIIWLYIYILKKIDKILTGF